ncbi:carbamoyltransferase HypF [Aceticella autotrophica]|nr:carbamoyltransferase HypF [Aceticella autotrophica]
MIKLEETMRDDIKRVAIKVKGIVQGVGFRPFVFSKAVKYNLNGLVLNSSSGVYIELEGKEKDIAAFIKVLKNEPPILAKIDKIEIQKLDYKGYDKFSIVMSKEDDGVISVSPDMGTCEDCLREMRDKKDRRYGYPFINCTNCGPRFTIIKDIPYDRDKTSMSIFPMCSECKKEYEDPLDRRFHAQPVACFQCGPSLAFIGEEMGKDEIEKAAKLLKKGKILAIKGLGGFHLSVNALNEEAVRLLRKRKNRYGKPLAVMMKDIEQINEYCFINEEEKKLLESPKKPIVLLRKKNFNLAKSISDNLNRVGVLLPYTPLHYLLMDMIDFPVVMTSGNFSEEPLCKDNEDALNKLSSIADGFLLHDRDIVNRIDDTVTSFVGGRERIIRRARGYAPQPLICHKTMESILACGSFYKNTFCLTRENYAFLSHHIGDLDNDKTYNYYKEEIEKYKKLFKIEPKIVAYDMHPGYVSTLYGKNLNLPHIAVQHHHAHIASCMAEYGIDEKVIGVAYDGTGYGEDGKLWGAEFMIADFKGYKRVGHLNYVSLPGGELAIKKIYRVALGYIYKDIKNYKEFLSRFDKYEIDLILKQIERGINTPKASSMGRLFDAAASLIDIEDEVLYEGQAAMEMESIIEEDKSYYDFEIISEEGSYIINTEGIFHGLFEDYRRKVRKGIIAARFHNSVIKFTIEMVKKLHYKYKINKVVLSGGSFQNVYLLENIINILSGLGFEVFSNSLVPCNDGGISLGQAFIANEISQIEK